VPPGGADASARLEPGYGVRRGGVGRFVDGSRSVAALRTARYPGRVHLDLVRPIRVFACDIDGCLAVPGHAAYDLGRLHAIAELNRASVHDPTVPALTIVTGRPHPYVDAVMQALDVRLPASFENGAGLATRHPYRAWLLPEAGAGLESLRRMIEIVEARDDVFLQMGKVASLSVFWTDRERPLQELVDLLHRLIEEHDLPLDVDPSTDCVNVLPPGVDKAVGFRALCAAAGVEQGAVAGIGDSVGDLPWLRLCGIGVAPLVAADAVRAEVTHASDLPAVEAALATYEALVAANRRWVAERGAGAALPSVGAG
jgi:hydroxymethylpyrimidine pyrophosphatase-like HAD family hydrolase